MAISRTLRRVNLVSLPPELQKQFALNEQRREISALEDLTYRRQQTGSFWRYAQRVGLEAAIDPPGDIATLPTSQLSLYPERNSDSFDMTSLKQAKSLRLMIERVTEREGRLPHAIRLHPFAAAVLALTDICSTNEQGSKYVFYAGVIPLINDTEVSVTKLILTWNDPFLEIPFEFFTA
jgi:hypothetical protein